MSDSSSSVQVNDLPIVYKPIGFGKQMAQDTLNYGMSVIVARALPDVRDGNKPIHRRILSELLGLYGTASLVNRNVKSAKIVGGVMGSLHPHGDSSIYEAMVRMGQHWKMNVLFVDPQGNFGSRDGDSPAAMRYTEAKASSFAVGIREDYVQLEKNWKCRTTFDNSNMEPTVLPVRVPLLLVNGAVGIAVGMASSIPPHNLNEVIDATLMKLDNPDVSVSDLMSVIKGPDFPTKGIIYGENNIKEMYETGRGSILMSGRYKIIENKKGDSVIHITELPYDVSFSSVLEKIDELRLPVKGKRGQPDRPPKITGIVEAPANIGNKKVGPILQIKLKKGVNPEYIMAIIRKETDFEKRFSANMTALTAQSRPEVMSLKTILGHFIDFRQRVVFDRSNNQLNILRDQLNNNIAAFLATTNIDAVIDVLRSSSDRHEQKVKLCNLEFPVQGRLKELLHDVDPDAEYGETFFMNDEQADYIVERKLSFLARLQGEQIASTISSILEKIRYHEHIVSDRKRLNEIIREELESQRKFAVPRQTEVQPYEPGSVTKADTIVEKDVLLTLTKENYIKITPMKGISAQARGGKGRSGGDLKENDFVTTSMICSNKASLLMFTDVGRVYQLMAYEINETSLQSRGRPLINYVDIPEGEKVTNIIVQNIDEDTLNKESLMFVTRDGNVRRSDVRLFMKVNRSGKIAMDFSESGDSLVRVFQVSNDDDIMLFTKNSMMVRFPVEQLRFVGSRASNGVRGIKLGDGDYVIGATSVPHLDLTRGQREAFFTEEYKWTSPNVDGQKGETTVLTEDEIEDIAKKERTLIIVTENGMGKRMSSNEVSTTSRGSKGVSILRTNKKTGSLVYVDRGSNDDDIVLTTNENQMIRMPCKTIRVIGRMTSGVNLLNLKEEQHIVDVSITPHEEMDDIVE